jgi:ketosteroid isomerase-like protein
VIPDLNMQAPTVNATAFDPRNQRVIDFFETLSAESLSRLGTVYSPAAKFKDPFNDVVGTDKIAQVFRHMFETLQNPRFKVTAAMSQGQTAFLVWDFHFSRGKGPAVMTIHGVSRLLYGDDGRIAIHRDYWDPTEELFAKLPLVGGLVRWVRRRCSASA